MGAGCWDGCQIPGSLPWPAVGCEGPCLLCASVSPVRAPELLGEVRGVRRGPDVPPLSPVFCRVYMPDHSYVTIRSRLSASVQDILTSVTEKLQYSEEQSAREDALILVTMASSGGGCWAKGGGGVCRPGWGSGRC